MRRRIGTILITMRDPITDMFSNACGTAASTTNFACESFLSLKNGLVSYMLYVFNHSLPRKGLESRKENL